MITTIVCVDRNFGIGKNNNLLFDIPLDMLFFRNTTANSMVCMGYNTFLSLPNQKPLKNRVNVVLCPEGVELEDCLCYHDFNKLVDFLKQMSKVYEVFIIGGGQFYKLMLPYTDKCLITEVDEDGDATVFFPDIRKDDEWSLIDLVEKPICNEKTNGKLIRFNTYIRKTSYPKFSNKKLGIDLTTNTLDMKQLITLTECGYGNNGSLRLYRNDFISLAIWLKLYKESRLNNKYEDGYTLDPIDNLILKLNGIYFELLVNASGGVSKKDNFSFSVNQDFEHGADFETLPVQTKNFYMPPKQLEVKNCINMNNFNNIRCHDSLYVLVNSRADKKINYLCMCKAEDLSDPNLQIYEGLGTKGNVIKYKVINNRPWMTVLQNNYEKYALDTS